MKHLNLAPSVMKCNHDLLHITHNFQQQVASNNHQIFTCDDNTTITIPSITYENDIFIAEILNPAHILAYFIAHIKYHYQYKLCWVIVRK